MFHIQNSLHHRLVAFNFRITSTFVYLAITLNLSELFGNVYFNTALSGIIELPVLFLCFFLFKWFGRKLPVIGTLMAVGICCWVSVPFELVPGRLNMKYEPGGLEMFGKKDNHLCKHI